MNYGQVDILKCFSVQQVLDRPLRWGRLRRLGGLAYARHTDLIAAETRTAGDSIGKKA